jgi:hypothetical protein
VDAIGKTPRIERHKRLAVGIEERQEDTMESGVLSSANLISGVCDARGCDVPIVRS